MLRQQIVDKSLSSLLQLILSLEDNPEPLLRLSPGIWSCEAGGGNISSHHQGLLSSLFSQHNSQDTGPRGASPLTYTSAGKGLVKILAPSLSLSLYNPIQSRYYYLLDPNDVERLSLQ